MRFGSRTPIKDLLHFSFALFAPSGSSCHFIQKLQSFCISKQVKPSKPSDVLKNLLCNVA